MPTLTTLARYHLQAGTIVNEERYKGRTINVRTHIIRIKSRIGVSHRLLRVVREDLKAIVVV